MADVVRSALLLGTCLHVLAEADQPLPGKEVLARVEQRVQLTPYEREPVNDSGQPRWDNHLRWYSGDATTIGWMTKRDGLWSLTEAGEAALARYGQEQLSTEVKRRYHEIRQQRQQAVKALTGDEQLIADVLSVVDPGS